MGMAADSPISEGAVPAQRLKAREQAQRRLLPDALTRLVFGRPLPPTDEEWRAIEAGVQRGDPAMDAVVDWIFSVGARQGRALFDQALEQGIDTLEDPPVVLREFFATIETPPAWLRPELLDTGARASHLQGNVSFLVLRDQALMGGYVYFNSMNQTLAASGDLAGRTSERLGETGKWLHDVTEPGGLERFGRGFITTIRVRLVHALVRRNLLRKDDWDTGHWGVPINQVDMQSTYLAFGPVSLLGARAFGVPIRLRDAAAMMHLWRYVGWLMGLDESRLAINERDGLRKLYHTFLTHECPDDKIGQLGQALRDEPLRRPLPDTPPGWRSALRRRFLYHQHLSNSSLILGPIQRRRLGLPWWTLPWYPLLSGPIRFVVLGVLQLSGPLRERYRRKARARQKALLASYFGERDPDIIQPDAHHPAHL